MKSVKLSDHTVTLAGRGRQPSALGHQEGLQGARNFRAMGAGLNSDLPDSQNDLRELETQTFQETFREMLVIL